MQTTESVTTLLKNILENLSFYDQDTCPAGSNAFLKAARRGEFKTYRPGKRLLARREDVDRWILGFDVTPVAVDQVDQLLAAGGVSRAA